jgi:hypothetical protein
MTNKVRIHDGRVRNITIKNMTFGLIQGLKTGNSGSWITVDPRSAEGTGSDAIKALGATVIRVKVDTNTCFEIFDTGSTPSAESAFVEEIEETDDEIMERLRERFAILEEMTGACVDGTIRGMVVAGPPGVGKSYGIEKVIDMAHVCSTIGNGEAKFGMEKGAATPIGLYKMMFEYSSPGSVLVLDDSDTILFDDTSLNLLKAALDSGKRRRISWRSESRALENAGVPDSYDFEGSVIFVTNLKLEAARGKIGDHMQALLSRCHYLDLTINTTREKFLRCKQIIQDGMLARYGFNEEQKDEILNYVYDNQDRLRELSLRMVSKIADLYKMSPKRWKQLAENTCIR